MPVITNIEDLRQLARKRVPRAIFDYVDRGSYDEISYRANTEELKAIRFRQRVLIDASNRSLETTMLGEKVAMPVAIAPTGLTGLMHRDGEMAAARAAEKAGVRFTLSTMSICSIEDVRSAIQNPFWFQLYVFRDRGFSESVIARAQAAGCTALFVTVDLPLRGQRHADLKNNLEVPPRLTLRNALDVMTKPGWAFSVLGGRRKTFGNIDAYIKGKGNVWAAGAWANDNFDSSLSWDDVAWVRKQWRGKLVLKGILDAEDAKKAADLGADAIVVSNHGGRQLDGAPATITALPRIADAAGDRIEILFDGGVRSGQDVLKALALGARGCLIGRAYLYGLAAMGEAGVTKALKLIEDELRVSLSLTGVKDVGKVSRDILFDKVGDPRREI
ncbi:MAG TPA: alpha-hydroxy acid oxidase [Pseudolabrys sp.]|nr:alpha-hydroxy acid oxidase [Pseudolabrys sp.]